MDNDICQLVCFGVVSLVVNIIVLTNGNSGNIV